MTVGEEKTVKTDINASINEVDSQVDKTGSKLSLTL
jgi:hypothetical protein